MGDDTYAEAYAVVTLNENGKGTNNEIIKQMKSYLSRGISLTADMYAGNSKMTYYHPDSIPHIDCDPTKIDHAVNIVGYGRKNGKEVWVVRNSWGQGWGTKGYFYLEIGRNSFCIESFNFATIPKDYDPNDGLHANIGNHTRMQDWGLDLDDGEIVPNEGDYFKNSNETLIIILSVVAAAVVLIIGAIVLIVCINKHNKRDKSSEMPIL